MEKKRSFDYIITNTSNKQQEIGIDEIMDTDIFNDLKDTISETIKNYNLNETQE